MLPAEALALERLLVRRKELASVLLNVDMFDRWGPKDGAAHARMMADGAAAQRDHAEVTAALTALATATRARSPEVTRAWAEAHIALLQRFIASHPGASDDTARFVAQEESNAWLQVAQGDLPFVDENCFYIHIDPADHAEWFGPR
jgi:hypothetical protein